MQEDHNNFDVPVQADVSVPSGKKRYGLFALLALSVFIFLTVLLFRHSIWQVIDSVFYTMATKPVIYLYPEEKTSVSVKLGFDDKTLTCTYPKYDNGWVVDAEPDGTLFSQDGQEYSYLFWEAQSTFNYDLSTGFIVEGADAESFLREKLSYMGLVPKEYNEFIVYWLPKLEANEYNLIHFAQEEYTEHFPLIIEPQPDSVLRVFMVMKAAGSHEKVEPQVLKPFQRSGFAVVEWGGTQLS